MKYNLLEVVQTILSSLDSDEVNSVGDSVESLQAANIAKQAYFNIVYKGGLPENKTLFELNASLDPSLPIIMYRPDNIQDVKWVKYNKSTLVDPTPNFDIVSYVCVEDFLDRMYHLNITDPNTVSGTLTTNGSDSITLYWKNNVAPTFYTSFDDKTLIFDSYDNSLESTLQKTKSLGYGTTSFEFRMEDTFVPTLDEAQHQLWLNEAKALAWVELKQTTHQKAEVESRKGWVNLMKTKRGIPSHTNELNRLPNYGRCGGTVIRGTRRGRDTW